MAKEEKIKVYSGGHVTRNTFKFQTAKVCKDLFVYKLVEKTKISNHLDGTETIRSGLKKNISHTTQGFMSQEDICNFLDGKPYTGDYSKFLLVNKEWIDLHHTEGCPNDDKYCNKLQKLQSKNPFDDFTKSKMTEVVVSLWDCHMLENFKGEKLPVAMFFDYMSGYINNAHYDLEIASKILRKRKDVIIFMRDDGLHETVNDIGIRNIPYYNESNLCNHHISFKWIPSVKNYRRMWDKCLEIGGKYPSTNRYQAIFDLDMLGLISGGAAYYDEFCSSREYDDNYTTNDEY